jgi:hypothetical protein
MVDTEGTNVNRKLARDNQDARDAVDAGRVKQSRRSGKKSWQDNSIDLPNGESKDVRNIGYDELQEHIADHTDRLNNLKTPSTETAMGKVEEDDSNLNKMEGEVDPNYETNTLESNLKMLNEEKGTRDRTLNRNYKRNRTNAVRDMKYSIDDMNGQSGKFN